MESSYQNYITENLSTISRQSFKTLILLWVILELFSLKTIGQNFENRSAELGVIHSFSSDNEYGAGVSCVDFNLDGLDDITLPSVDSTLFFFQNTGDSFIKLDLIDRVFGEVKSVCWVDFDNDSDLDLSLTEYNGSLFLFENIGDLELIDITDSTLLTNESCHNFGHSWVDINQDGFLDVYLNRYFYGQDCSDYGSENLLFVNNGDNTFTERASEFGISDGDKMSFQSSFYDYDKDGLLDLHIINDRFYENSLYRNTGLGYFEDVSEAADANLIQDAMTSTIFDFNLDGFHDIYFTNTWPNGNHLLVYNPETESYEDQFPDFGAESYLFNWGAIPIDYDNDKFTDLAISSGAGCGTGCSNLLYRNNGNSFSQTPNNFNEEASTSYGVAKGDFNSDGFYDITFLNEAPSNTDVYINAGNSKKWVKVNFSGACNNFFGVGVQYEYFMNGVATVNTVFAGSNFLSQDSYTHILGMGNESSIDSISINWTSGLTETHYSLSPFETHSFKEGQTFDTSLNPGDSIYICPDEEIEIESTTQYLNTIWNTGENTSSLTTDTPGTYYAYLEVEPGINICSDTILVELKPDITLNSIATQDPSCFGSEDGSAILTHNDSLGNPIISSYSNLTDGISILPVTDDYLCSILVSVELSSPPPLFSYAKPILLPCDSSDVGEVELFSIGGTAPYAYSIEDLSAIPFGENTIIASDTNGCIYPFNFYLELAPETFIELIITPQTGDDLGSVEVTNPTSEDAEYILQDGFLNTVNGTELTAGNYTITYWNIHGCQIQENFIVEQLNLVSQQSESVDLRVFPNPTNGAVNISNCENIQEVLIYSYEGRLVKKLGISESCTLEVSDLDSGTYILKLHLSDFQIFNFLLVKN